MLSPDGVAIVQQMAAGAALKVHRTLEGAKVCCLHPLYGPAQELPTPLVDGLKREGLIESNMKFPAATYRLTPEGRRLAETSPERG